MILSLNCFEICSVTRFKKKIMNWLGTTEGVFNNNFDIKFFIYFTYILLYKFYLFLDFTFILFKPSC